MELEEFRKIALDIQKKQDLPWAMGSNYSIAEDYVKKFNLNWKEADAKADEIAKSDAFDFMYIIHETGGVSGGSCWDSSNPQPYYRSEPMPDFNAFYLLLEELTPNLGFLQVKRMESECIKSCEHTDREYYGNRTEYAVKYVNITDMYNFMVEKGYLT